MVRRCLPACRCGERLGQKGVIEGGGFLAGRRVDFAEPMFAAPKIHPIDEHRVISRPEGAHLVPDDQCGRVIAKPIRALHFRPDIRGRHGSGQLAEQDSKGSENSNHF